jgi:phage-related protein
VSSAVLVRFYATGKGNEPVRDWLRKECTRQERSEYGASLRILQNDYPQGRPLVGSFRGGLFEVVCEGPEPVRSARVLFCFYDGAIVLLHAIFKKSQKTPKADVALARKRMKNLSS